jgi:hypothetical protein
VTRGNSSSFYDSRGHFSGSAIRHGNSTSFYDGRGRYTGSVINTSPRRRATSVIAVRAVIAVIVNVPEGHGPAATAPQFSPRPLILLAICVAAFMVIRP